MYYLIRGVQGYNPIRRVSGLTIGRLSGVGALWDCVSRVCGGRGGCAGGGVPLGAGPCCPDVGRCLSGVNIILTLTLTRTLT